MTNLRAPVVFVSAFQTLVLQLAGVFSSVQLWNNPALAPSGEGLD